MGFFNPFHDIYANESDKHIHAHTLRTSLWEKMKDTFFVFAGTGIKNNFRKDEGFHLGLFDYLTLGIPYWLDHMMEKMSNMKEYTLLLNPVDHVFIVLFGLAANLARFTLAGVFTLIALPIISVIHAVSSIASYAIKENANKLPIQSSIGRHWGDDYSLGEFLAKKGLSYEDIDIYYDSGESYTGKKLHDPRLGYSTKDKSISISKDFSFFTPLNNDSLYQNIAAFEAVLELNIGGLASKFNEIPDEKFKIYFPNEEEIDEATSLNI